VNDKFKFSDEKLILRFQEGDINAYNELVKRYKDRLLNFVFRYFNNVEQAEDVVQDTLIKLYTHASYYKNVAKFSTWIFTIAKNNALTELRKNKRKKTDSLWTDDGKFIDISSKEESVESKVQNEIAIDQLNKF
jgi:RNA polymerase sigma factor, sigma-70 family